MKKTPKKANIGQKQKAIQAAHMLEADHDELAFEKRLKKIENSKQKRTTKKPQKRPSHR